MSDERNCKECKHYVVSDVKRNYEQNGCGMYDAPIYACESWNCEFAPKGGEENKADSD